MNDKTVSAVAGSRNIPVVPDARVAYEPLKTPVSYTVSPIKPKR